MRLIPLTQGKSAIVDDEDYTALSSFKWHFHMGYAKRAIYPNGKQRILWMHRVKSLPASIFPLDSHILNTLP